MAGKKMSFFLIRDLDPTLGMGWFLVTLSRDGLAKGDKPPDAVPCRLGP